VLLGVLFQAAELKSPVSYPVKREYSLHDFARSARFEGLPYVQPEPFPIPTQNAARVFWWLQEGRPAVGGGSSPPGGAGPQARGSTDARGEAAARGWARAVFRAFFQRGLPLNDVPTLKRIATEHGLDADEAEAVWNDPQWKERLKQANEAAQQAGVFGAPFFVVDGEPFWGNDRRAQLERWLAQGPF
jgi:2-hydroxychromene-2-carboxylate isomerase